MPIPNNNLLQWDWNKSQYPTYFPVQHPETLPGPTKFKYVPGSYNSYLSVGSFEDQVLPEVVIRPEKGVLSNLQEALPGKNLRNDFYAWSDKYVDTNKVPSRNISQAEMSKRLYNLYERADKPGVNSKGIVNIFGDDENRPSWGPLLNNIHIPEGVATFNPQKGAFGEYLAELSHALQFNDKSLKKYGLYLTSADKLSMINNYGLPDDEWMDSEGKTHTNYFNPEHWELPAHWILENAEKGYLKSNTFGNFDAAIEATKAQNKGVLDDAWKKWNSRRQAYGGNLYKKGSPKRTYKAWKAAIRQHKGIDIDNDNTYDYRGYYTNNTDAAWDMLNKDSDAHFTDKYKLPSHPTFSEESKHSHPPYVQGGHWSERPSSMGQQWNYQFSPTQVSTGKRVDEVIDYASDAENEGLYVTDSKGRYPVINGTVEGGVLPNVEVESTYYPKREYAEGGALDLPKLWDNLSMKERRDIIRVGVQNGYSNLSDIKAKYNEFALGGNLYKKGGRKSSGGSGYNAAVQKAMSYFMGKGLTQYQAAGLVGNLMRESGLQIGAVNPTSGAYGIAQWLGPRKSNLFARYGKNPTLDQQLDYVWHELNSTHRTGLKHIMNSKDAAEAARNAFGYYEFSAGPEGAIAAMNKSNQNGTLALNRGIEFASNIMGIPYDPNAIIQADASIQQGTPAMDIPFDPSNPDAFFNPAGAYEYPIIINQSPDISEAEIKAAQEQKAALERYEKQQELNNLVVATQQLAAIGRGGASSSPYTGIPSMVANASSQNPFFMLPNVSAYGGNIFDEGGKIDNKSEEDDVFLHRGDWFTETRSGKRYQVKGFTSDNEPYYVDEKGDYHVVQRENYLPEVSIVGRKDAVGHLGPYLPDEKSSSTDNKSSFDWREPMQFSTMEYYDPTKSNWPSSTKKSVESKNTSFNNQESNKESSFNIWDEVNKYSTFTPMAPAWEFGKSNKQSATSNTSNNTEKKESYSETEKFDMQALMDENSLQSIMDYPEPEVGGVRWSAEVAKKAEEEVQQKQKAIARANRNTKTPYYDATADLQDNLWKVGAFSGIKTRRGEDVDYKRAVDGIRGRMTNKAIENAQQMGYEIDFNTGKLTMNSQKAALDESVVVGDSKSINLPAVIEHKKKYNVKGTSWYFDPTTSTGYRLEGAKVAEKFPIISGLNSKYDGYTPLTVDEQGNGVYDRGQNLSATGAGIYTFANPQKMRGYGDESVYLLREGSGDTGEKGRLTNMALHTPTTPQRVTALNSPSIYDNWASFGCLNTFPGKITQWENEGLIHGLDSVYIQPKQEGNYIYEDKDGRLKTYWGNAPTRATGYNNGQYYDLYPLKYNRGYAEGGKLKKKNIYALGGDDDPVVYSQNQLTTTRHHIPSEYPKDVLPNPGQNITLTSGESGRMVGWAKDDNQPVMATPNGDYYAFTPQAWLPEVEVKGKRHLPTDGLDMMFADLLTGGYASMAKSADESAQRGSYLTAAAKYLSPLFVPPVLRQPIKAAGAIGRGLLGSGLVDLSSNLLTGRNWAQNISNLTGLTEEDATLTNPGLFLSEPYWNGVKRRGAETFMRTGSSQKPFEGWWTTTKSMFKNREGGYPRLGAIGTYTLTGAKIGNKGYYNSFAPMHADGSIPYYGGFWDQNEVAAIGGNDYIDAFLYRKPIDERYGLYRGEQGENLGIHEQYVDDIYPDKKEAIPIYYTRQDHQSPGNMVYKDTKSVESSMNTATGHAADVAGHGKEISTAYDAQGNNLGTYAREQDIWKFNPEEYYEKWLQKQYSYKDGKMTERKHPYWQKRLMKWGLKEVDDMGTPVITRGPYRPYNANVPKKPFDDSDFSYKSNSWAVQELGKYLKNIDFSNVLIPDTYIQ